MIPVALSTLGVGVLAAVDLLVLGVVGGVVRLQGRQHQQEFLHFVNS